MSAVIRDADLALDGPVVALVAEATAAIVRLDAEVGAAAAAVQAILLRTEAASSSQIEQLTASAKAIAASEAGQKGRVNADQIVANVNAMRAAATWSGPLDQEAILGIHRTLMTETLRDEAGQWRKQQVWTGGTSRSPHGATYVPPVAERVPAAIEDLVAFMERGDLASLAQVAVCHAQFEAIHPFVDGNGRTGRALIHAQLRQAGLSTGAVVPVSAGLLADTGRYLAALNSYRAGDTSAIIVEPATAAFPAVAKARQLVADVEAARQGWLERLNVRTDAAARRFTGPLGGWRRRGVS